MFIIKWYNSGQVQQFAKSVKPLRKTTGKELEILLHRQEQSVPAILEVNGA